MAAGAYIVGGSCGVMLVAPCNANMMAKIAYGLADDLLSSTILACKAYYCCFGDDTRMWENKATQDNLALLKSRGVGIVDAGTGGLPVVPVATNG